MGPRSRERGRQVAVSELKPHPKLQWGRALGSAEGFFVRGLRRPNRFGFNGAALSGARKDVRKHEAYVKQVGFNGAALSGARKETELLKPMSTTNGASMGPRSRERGRLMYTK